MKLHGHQLDALITPQVDDDGELFVHFLLREPMTMFKMHSEHARHIAQELLEAADVIDRLSGKPCADVPRVYREIVIGEDGKALSDTVIGRIAED